MTKLYCLMLVVMGYLHSVLWFTSKYVNSTCTICGNLSNFYYKYWNILMTDQNLLCYSQIIHSQISTCAEYNTLKIKSLFFCKLFYGSILNDYNVLLKIYVVQMEQSYEEITRNMIEWFQKNAGFSGAAIKTA